MTIFKNSIKKVFRKNSIILLYHRINSTEFDPWNLSVTPAHFEQHLQVLKTFYKAYSLIKIVSEVFDKKANENFVGISFDDGYRDNIFFAKPLLEKYDCHATFFIPTQNTGLDKIFWWDDLAIIFLAKRKLPKTISLVINNQPFDFDLEDEVFLSDSLKEEHQNWQTPYNPPTKRSLLYFRVWQLLKPLHNDQIEEIMNNIKKWAGSDIPHPQREDYPVTEEQLIQLSDHPLCEIGLHTVTHTALGFQEEKEQEREIVDNKMQLKNFINKEVDMMAFPYGNYNNTTLKVIKKLKLKAAFTTKHESINQQSDPYQLGRFQVKNWDGEEFERRLFHWINQ